MKPETFNDSVTNQNKDLLEILQRDKTIHFRISPEDFCWGLSKQGANEYTIIAHNDQPSPENLTHELLHIKLEKEGFADMETAHKATNIARDVIEEYSNDLAHFKMIDDFVSMGFDKPGFLAAASYQTLSIYEKDLTDSSSRKNLYDFTVHLIRACLQVEFFDRNVLGDTQTLRKIIEGIDAALLPAMHQLVDRWMSVPVDQNIDILRQLDDIQRELFNRLNRPRTAP